MPIRSISESEPNRGEPSNVRIELSTFLKTIAGKALLATGIVTLAFGGAAAAGFAEMPVLSSPPQDAADDSSTDDSTTDDSTTDDSSTDDSSTDEELNHGQIVSEFAQTTELEGCEKGQAIAELASSNASEHRQNPETDHDPCGTDELLDDGTEDAGSESDDPTSELPVDEPTHGEIVSEFARTTELEGCEKGQAISELASGKSSEATDDPEAEADADADHDPCSHAGVDESTEDAAGDELTESNDDAGGPGKSENRGKPAKTANGNGNGRND